MIKIPQNPNECNYSVYAPRGCGMVHVAQVCSPMAPLSTVCIMSSGAIVSMSIVCVGEVALLSLTVQNCINLPTKPTQCVQCIIDVGWSADSPLMIDNQLCAHVVTMKGKP